MYSDVSGTRLLHSEYRLFVELEGIMQLITVAKALLSQVLKTSKDGDCPTSPGNLLHCLTVLTGTIFPYIQSEALLLQLRSIIPCPPIMHLCEVPASVFWLTTHYVWDNCCEVTLKPSLIQAEHTQLPYLLLTGQALQPLTSFMDLC